MYPAQVWIQWIRICHLGLRARGQRRAGSIAGAMPHVRVAGVAQQQQLSSESSTSTAVSARIADLLSE